MPGLYKGYTKNLYRHDIDFRNSTPSDGESKREEHGTRNGHRAYLVRFKAFSLGLQLNGTM